jgi:hypothetical protein
MQNIKKFIIVGLCIWMLSGTVIAQEAETTPAVEDIQAAPPTATETPLPTEPPAATFTEIPTEIPTDIPTETPTELPAATATEIPLIQRPEVTEAPIPQEVLPPAPVQVLSNPLQVVNTNDSGEGSLRAAIEYADSNPGADTITFNIPGSGPFTIALASPLPTIVETVTIDGLSQPGASCANWPPTLKIEIAGGLSIDGNGSVVRGLAINNGISLSANNVVIQCNFLGTDITGTVAKNSDRNGITFIRAHGALIGGIGAGTRNLISGNQYGLRADEEMAFDLTVQNNYIGTDVTGQFALGNSQTGISVDTGSLIVGGTTPGAGNVISGNGTGIFATYDGDFSLSGYNGIIQGNYIGTNASGTAAIPNGNGIYTSFAPYLIGGTEPGARNLISGNTGTGVAMYVEAEISGLIQGNYIGTDVTGTQAIGNGEGVSLGRDIHLENNLISGNVGHGVSTGADQNSIMDNLIGVGANGTQPLGNGGDGVNIVLSGYDIFIFLDVGNNTIGNNGGNGITITGGESDYSASIGGNRIFNNGKLGIDLDNDGVTLNDPGDVDRGTHGLQNFPVITSAIAGATNISGTLNSAANATFSIEIFIGICDPSGYGEGALPIGTATVHTDANGNGSFFAPVSMPLMLGYGVTAMVTGGYADPQVFFASEFSACVPVTEGVPVDLTVVTNTNDSGAGSLRTAIEYANSNPGPDTITFNIPGDGPHIIQPASPLPDITDVVTIDGLTQPGASCDSWPPDLKVEIQGRLTVDGDNSTIRGLVINTGGLWISASGTLVQCNFLGTDITGTIAKNNDNGVVLSFSTDTLIGGIGQGTRNLISGNGGSGILSLEGAASGITIQNNYIGVDVTGQTALGNTLVGVWLNSSNNVQIGGTEAGAGNVISGNGVGIRVGHQNVPSFEVVGSIQGNFVGTNAAGTAAIPNNHGMFIGDASMVVGGAEPGARNIISGNTNVGIDVFTLLTLTRPVNQTVVQGNYIGTDVTGTQAVPNGFGAHVGNRVDFRQNVVSGNLGNGVNVDGEDSRLTENLIGVTADGLQPLGNGGDGIAISLLSSTRMGVQVVNGTIAYNQGNGVVVTGESASRNAHISPAVITNNGKLGIDLGGDGVTPNDLGDVDGGPNKLQNYPVITRAIAGTTLVEGFIHTTPNSLLSIGIFMGDCDDSGFGEGALRTGSVSVTTDSQGNGNFSTPVVFPLQPGQFVTAMVTAGDLPGGNSDIFSSEFSACFPVTQAAPAAPSSVHPAEGAQVIQSRPSFTWSSVPNAVRYRLQVLTLSGNLVINAESDFTSAAPGTLTQGPYLWRVQARDRFGNWGPFSPLRRFVLNVQQTPANATDTTSRQPTFQWYAYNGARNYQLQVDNNFDFSSPEFTCERTYKQTLACTPSQPLPFGDYYWRVNIDTGQGFVTSPVRWQVAVRVSNLSGPGLIAPAHGATTSTTPTFSWTAVSGASAYQIIIARSPDFSDVAVSETTTALTFSTTLSPGTYYWRVRGLNAASQPGGWSSPRSFRVG